MIKNTKSIKNIIIHIELNYYVVGVLRLLYYPVRLGIKCNQESFGFGILWILDELQVPCFENPKAATISIKSTRGLNLDEDFFYSSLKK
tara:strand:- start:12594 stop:12860 length:267 start_codon:yes stop_codon:yes gene_type:complete